MCKGRGDDDDINDGYDYDAAYDAGNKACGNFDNTESISVIRTRKSSKGTALEMARTKDQARAGREESTQRSAAINGRDESRVGAATSGKAYGDEASSSSGSDRARRAAIRGRRVEQVTATATNKDDHAGPSAITYHRSN